MYEKTYERIEALSKVKGITVSQAAKNIGFAPTVFTDLKTGKSKPKVDKLLMTSRYFGVPLEYLLGEEGLSAIFNVVFSLLPNGMNMWSDSDYADEKHIIIDGNGFHYDQPESQFFIDGENWIDTLKNSVLISLMRGDAFEHLTKDESWLITKYRNTDTDGRKHIDGVVVDESRRTESVGDTEQTDKVG